MKPRLKFGGGSTMRSGRSNNLAMKLRVCALALTLTVFPGQWANAQAPVAGAEVPRSGGTVVVATLGEPPHLNPAITTMGSVHAVTGSIYNGLVGLDERASPVPELAERWQVSDADKT